MRVVEGWVGWCRAGEGGVGLSKGGVGWARVV